ncbi:MAG: BREX system ATP-binding domain-containing protein [Candidatus Bathyarchaeia archaeon]
MSLDEQGFIDLSNLQKKNYSKLLLTRNPFPSTAVPSDLPLTTADRQAAIRRFLDVLTVLRTDNSSSVTVLLGDYGSGKSHLLKLFKLSVNRKLSTGDNPALAIYAKSPGRSMRDLFLYIVDDLGRELLTDLAVRWIFQNLSKAETQKYLAQKQSYVLNSYSDVPKYLSIARSLELVNDMLPRLAAAKNPDLVRAFLILPHPELGSIAWRWFVGSSLSRDEHKTLGIDSTIDDQSIAERALNAFLKLLHVIGLSGLVVLIDELEAITLITRMSRGLYQDALRHLIDGNPGGLAIMFAITPAEWEELTEVPSALERRLAGSVIDLAPFSKKEVLELVQRYLLTSRISGSAKKSETTDTRSTIEASIFPFTIAALDEIFSTTKGTVSKVVTLCRLCIENLASDTRATIDADYVKHVITREGFR